MTLMWMPVIILGGSAALMAIMHAVMATQDRRSSEHPLEPCLCCNSTQCDIAQALRTCVIWED